MDRKYENIDDLFRENTEEITPEVPASVKVNIDSAIGFKRKRIMFWRIFPVALLLLISGGFYMLSPFESNDKMVKNQSSNSKTRQPIENKKDVISKSKNAVEPSNFSTPLSQNENEEPEITVIAEPLANLHDKEDINPSTQVNHYDQKQPSTFKTDKINTNAKGEFKDNAESISTTQLSRDFLEKKTTLSNEKDLIQTENQSFINATEVTNKTPKLDSTLQQENVKYSTTDNSQFTPDSTEQSTVVVEIDSSNNELSTTHLDSSSIATTPIADTTNNQEQNTPIITPKKEEYTPWTIRLTGGINRVKTNYKADNMYDETIHQNAYTDELGWQTELIATYRLKKGLTFGIGAGYTAFTETYFFDNSTSTYFANDSLEFVSGYEPVYSYYYSIPFGSPEEIDTIAYVTDSTAAIVDTIHHTNYKAEKTEKYLTGVNKTEYFMIPVQLGTQMNFNKFKLDLYGAARFNIRYRSSGVYQVGNTFHSYNNSNSIYKRFYTDITLGTNLHYKIIGNLFATATVQYRPILGNPLTGVNFNKSFEYTHFGLGVSMQF